MNYCAVSDDGLKFSITVVCVQVERCLYVLIAISVKTWLTYQWSSNTMTLSKQSCPLCPKQRSIGD